MRSVPYLLGLLICVIADYFVGREVSLWLLSLCPIGLAAWNLGWRWGAVLSVLAVMGLAFVGFEQGHHFSASVFFAFSLFSKAIAYGIFVALIAALRRKEVERVWVRKGDVLVNGR
jgi:hypothetical protein